MLTFAIIFIFPFAMIYAACSDLVSMTIANRVSLILVVVFPVAAVAAGMPIGLISLHLGIGLLCLAVTYGFFAAGWMGGGDAKLLAATAVWFGPTIQLVEFLLLGAIYGGMLTIALLISRAQLAPVTGIDFVDRLLDQDTGIPYGIAIGLAGLTVYSGSVWMDIAIKGVAAASF
ncbi:A24 family peptidase [Aurantimonas marina]|uniref:A24 family peptidase n=1 Tax=Aurantimonas marina TaxID=2780508 RepID=UPI0019D2F35D|nr:prepilin peptidase [Aurantimonas marina]